MYGDYDIDTSSPARSEMSERITEIKRINARRGWFGRWLLRQYIGLNMMAGFIMKIAVILVCLKILKDGVSI